MARRQKQERQAVITSHREQIYIKDFVSRPVAEKAVALDVLDVYQILSHLRPLANLTHYV